MGKFAFLVSHCRYTIEHLPELGRLDVSVSIVRVQEHGPRLGCFTVLGNLLVALVSCITHEAEEKVLVFEVMITAHVNDMQVLDEGFPQANGLVAVGCMLFGDKPSGHLGCNEALRVGREVVGAVTHLNTFNPHGLLENLTELLNSPFFLYSFNHSLVIYFFIKA